MILTILGIVVILVGVAAFVRNVAGGLPLIGWIIGKSVLAAFVVAGLVLIALGHC